MTPLHDENDERPASGFREDAFDDRLREAYPPRALPESRDYFDSVEGRDEDAEPPRRRGRPLLADDPNRDARNSRMSQTEVGLRLAKHLSRSPLVSAAVLITLAGYELDRQGAAPDFPVTRYLSRWGYTRRRDGDWKYPWCGIYERAGARDIVVNFRKSESHVLTQLATGQRLAVFISAGSLVAEPRNPLEDNQLSKVLGRIVKWKGARPDDFLAVCLPRSERFRKLAADSRTAEGVKRARILILHVDRGDGCKGLAEHFS
jgi:hypothetical protein